MIREGWEVERDRFETEVSKLQQMWVWVMHAWRESYRLDRPELRKTDGRRLPIADSGPKGGQAGHAMSRRGAEPRAGRPTAVAPSYPEFPGSAAADPPRDRRYQATATTASEEKQP